MKEKQIEEIRKDIFAAFGGYAKWEEDWQSLAEAVCDAGYRKQIVGEWLEIDDGVLIGDGKHLECSECGVWKKDRQKSNFCPNCGAHMKGGAK